ncbi:Glycosyl transferase family 90 [Fragilaria crotonensis]|nr:Glycosyl transferase family 90 [Fragilaria crotonensis]
MARSSSQQRTHTMSKGLHLFSLCCLLLMGIAAVVVQDYKLLVAFSLSAHEHRMLRVDDEPPQPIATVSINTTTIAIKNGDLIPIFSQLDIQEALPYFHSWYMRLLVFDGQTWKTYAIGHKSTKLLPEFKSTGRLYQLIPMLVHSFVHNFPKRFQPGQPVFQVLFSEADLISSDCVFTNKACPSDKFPPILGFGSVFKDETLLPTLKMFPAPARWFACLYNYKTRNQRCKLNQQVNYAKLYQELTPQVVWRGADWPFLPHVKELLSEGF